MLNQEFCKLNTQINQVSRKNISLGFTTVSIILEARDILYDAYISFRLQILSAQEFHFVLRRLDCVFRLTKVLNA